MSYSHSQIQTYLNCQLRYRFEKVDKITPKTPTDNLTLLLGTVVHSTLEYLYNKVSDFKSPKLDDLLVFYEDIWKKELIRVNEKYDRVLFEVNDINDFKKRWEEYIKYYYEAFSPFDSWIPMKMEESIAFNLWEEVSFRWKIDRIDIEKDTIVIIDYKTSKSFHKDEEDTYKEQIILYSFHIKNSYQDKIKKFKWRVHYLHLKFVEEFEITDGMIEKVIAKYKLIWEEIEGKKNKYKAGEKDVFIPKKSGLCNYCIYKNICPYFAHELIDWEDVEVATLGKTSIKFLVDNLAKIKEKLNILEEDKELYSKILTDYAKENEFKTLYWDEYKASISYKKEYNSNKEKKDELKNLLSQRWLLEEIIDIDRHKLGKIIKDWKVEKEFLWDTIIENNSVYISRTSEKTDKDENDEDEYN